MENAASSLQIWLQIPNFKAAQALTHKGPEGGLGIF